MKLLIQLGLILTLICCDSKDSVDRKFIEKEIKLIDLEMDSPFALLKISIPVKFDTFYTWIERSDCTCCEIAKYRFTSKKRCLIQEQHIYSIKCENNIDCLTISHQCGGNKWKNIKELHEEVSNIDINRSKTKYLPPVKWEEKALKVINNNNYYILQSTSNDCNSNHDTRLFTAKTLIGNTDVTLALECNLSNCQNFRDLAYQIINSIKINL